jgi:hypothetical protein
MSFATFEVRAGVHEKIFTSGQLGYNPAGLPDGWIEITSHVLPLPHKFVVFGKGLIYNLDYINLLALDLALVIQPSSTTAHTIDIAPGFTLPPYNTMSSSTQSFILTGRFNTEVKTFHTDTGVDSAYNMDKVYLALRIKADPTTTTNFKVMSHSILALQSD